MDFPYIDIHTHHCGEKPGIITVQSYFLQEVNPSITTSFTAGIHPWHVNGFSIEEVKILLENLIGHPGLIGIGEIGLDRVSSTAYDQQKRIFEAQLLFAEKYNFPIVIHVVKSWNDMIVYLKKVHVPFILHGYMASKEITRQLIQIGAYFSLGASIMNPNFRFHEVIKTIPLSSLFLETDESTVPIEGIYLELSKIKGISLNDLKCQIYENYIKLFHLSNNVF
ncbi:MAG: TatD family hydrolase [Mariniphaga sp.]